MSLDYSTTPGTTSAAEPSGSFTTWNAFFGNSEAGCGFTSCVLRDAGDCAGTTFSHSSELSIAGADPFAITASQTVPVGYSHSVCVRCLNSDQTVDLDNW